VSKLTEIEWARIVSLYQSGEVSITQLGRRFGVTYEGIRYGLKQRNVLEPSRELKRKGLPSVGKAATANL
jgi:hypothetical protein